MDRPKLRLEGSVDHTCKNVRVYIDDTEISHLVRGAVVRFAPGQRPTADLLLTGEYDFGDGLELPSVEVVQDARHPEP